MSEDITIPFALFASDASLSRSNVGVRSARSFSRSVLRSFAALTASLSVFVVFVVVSLVFHGSKSSPPAPSPR